MARSLETIDAEIDRLRAAIGSGALRVRFADRDVTYRSMDEMRQALAFLEQEKADLGGARRVRAVQFIGSKGL